jgi:hypothetical protein
MRTLIVIAVIVVFMVFSGWLTYQWSGSRATINIETEEIRDDTQEFVDETKDALNTAAQEVDEVLTKPDRPPPPQPRNDESSPEVNP